MSDENTLASTSQQLSEPSKTGTPAQNVAGTDLTINKSEPTEETSPIRPDQVKNAVQFLLHPKVQNSSMDERRKFLLKKGLSAPEIDEAFRVAQPDLDRLANSPQAPLPANNAPPPASLAVVAAAPAPPPPPPPPPTSVWQVLLAAAALLGLGTGLGLLVKKYGVLGIGGGGEAARPAPSHEMELLLGKLDAMQSSIDSNSRLDSHSCCGARSPRCLPW